MEKCGRNDPCPCGSGRKYKRCHGANGVRPEHAEAPSRGIGTHDELRSLIDHLSASGHISKDEALGTLDKFREMLAFEHAKAEILAACDALEPYREEYARLAEDWGALLRRATSLFAEEPFADLLFTADDAQRAFAQVGFPHIGMDNETRMDLFDKAVAFLLPPDQREVAGKRLWMKLPDYVRAGRHIDALLIEHSAVLLIEHPESLAGAFLMCSWLEAVSAWEKRKQHVTDEVLRELGLNPDELANFDPVTISGKIEQAMERPGAQQALERAFAEHPELKEANEASLIAAEKAAVAFLASDESKPFHVEDEVAIPWAARIPERMQNRVPRLFSAFKSGQRDLSPKTYRRGTNVLYDLAEEMSEAVFTAERRNRLQSRVLEYRAEAGDKSPNALAIQGLMFATAPGASLPNHVLTALCWMALKRAIERLASDAVADA